MNARQVADLRRSYNIRAGIQKKGMARFRIPNEKRRLANRALQLKINRLWSKY